VRTVIDNGRRLSFDERAEVITMMADNFGAQEFPKVGFFWFDVAENELFGVVTTLAKDIPFNMRGKKTVGMLHKNYWYKESKRAAASGRPSRFTGDYTLIPRGRIFEIEGKGFEVLTGSWIDEYPLAKDLIVEEFDLQDVHVEFVHDEHWDIGHGWSEEVF